MVVKDGAEALTGIRDAESATWVDLDDDVRPRSEGDGLFAVY